MIINFLRKLFSPTTRAVRYDTKPKPSIDDDVHRQLRRELEAANAVTTKERTHSLLAAGVGKELV